MDHFELAKRISQPLAREVTYVPQEIEDFRAQFANNPNAPAHLVQHLCEVAQDYQDGLFKGTNGCRRADHRTEATKHRGVRRAS